jgi:hypothetical protein
VAAALLVTAATAMLVLPRLPALLFRCCILGRSLLDHVGLILRSCKPNSSVGCFEERTEDVESRSQRIGVVVDCCRSACVRQLEIGPRPSELDVVRGRQGFRSNLISWRRRQQRQTASIRPQVCLPNCFHLLKPHKA